MKGFKVAALVAGLGFGAAQAAVINFVEKANTGVGESAWDALDLDGFGTVSGVGDGHPVPGPGYAYLDHKGGGKPYAHSAGLGVCDALIDDSYANKTSEELGKARHANICSPSGDDNVTGVDGSNEKLVFTFNKDVIIKKLWLNNNHDNGFNQEAGESFGSDKVRIGGSLVDLITSPKDEIENLVGGSNFYGEFTVAAGTAWEIEFYNEQFYVSGMEVVAAVPEPGTVGLMGLGLLMVGFVARRRKK